jgi:hypothetical protein
MNNEESKAEIYSAALPHTDIAEIHVLKKDKDYLR